MTDIAAGSSRPRQLAGRRAELVTDRLPRDPDVDQPRRRPARVLPAPRRRRRRAQRGGRVSVPICTEQPGTQWFLIGLSFCRPGAARPRHQRQRRRRSSGASASRPSGCRSAACRAWWPTPVERDIDVLFLGGDTARRGAVLSTLGPLLWDRRGDLRLFRFTEPVHGGVPGLVFGAGEVRCWPGPGCSSTSTATTQQPGYFEWARMIEAMANGATVVTEPSTGFEPLGPASTSSRPTTSPARVAELLDDEARARRSARRAPRRCSTSIRCRPLGAGARPPRRARRRASAARRRRRPSGATG